MFLLVVRERAGLVGAWKVTGLVGLYCGRLDAELIVEVVADLIRLASGNVNAGGNVRFPAVADG